MNLDFALVKRAMLNIGMAPITGADRRAENEEWLTAKQFFLQTMLEALSEVEWTGAKKRRELTPSMMPVKKHGDFAYVYDLPLDCAKSIELDGQAYFEVEGVCLFTDVSPARLLYVSNGMRVIDRESISGGGARRPPGYEYVTGGDAGRGRRYEWGDNVLSGGDAKKRKQFVPLDEDFPDYRALLLEPAFFLYWENLLSAKYALRLTDKPDLAMVFFNKAQSIGRAAEITSIEHSAARMKAPPSWQEELGLV